MKRSPWLAATLASMAGLGTLAISTPSGAGTITCFGRIPTILGTDSADVLVGTDGRDVIAGLGGNDVIKGLGRADLLCGFAGDDRVIGGKGADTIAGDEDNDVVKGGADADYLFGFGGDDIVDGGKGSDLASWFNATGGVDANLATGTASGEGSDTLVNIEDLEGGAFDDTLTGDAGPNTFIPGPGNDTIDGGGSPDDLVDYFFSALPVTADLGKGIVLAEGTDTVANVEGASGSKLSDTLSGDTGSNDLFGVAGDDAINGREGNDHLIGGQGNDALDGGPGTDELNGGHGTDTCLHGEANTSCEA